MLSETFELSYSLVKSRDHFLTKVAKYCSTLLAGYVVIIIILTCLKAIFKQDLIQPGDKYSTCFELPTDIEAYQVKIQHGWVDELSMQDLLFITPACPFKESSEEFQITYKSELVSISDTIGYTKSENATINQKPIKDCQGNVIAYFEYKYFEDQVKLANFTWNSFVIYSPNKKTIYSNIALSSDISRHYFVSNGSESDLYIDFSSTNSTFLVTVKNNSPVTDLRIVLSYLGTYFFLTNSVEGVCDKVQNQISRISYYTLIAICIPAFYLFIVYCMLEQIVGKSLHEVQYLG